MTMPAARSKTDYAWITFSWQRLHSDVKVGKCCFVSLRVNKYEASSVLFVLIQEYWAWCYGRDSLHLDLKCFCLMVLFKLGLLSDIHFNRRGMGSKGIFGTKWQQNRKWDISVCRPILKFMLWIGRVLVRPCPCRNFEAFIFILPATTLGCVDG